MENETAIAPAVVEENEGKAPAQEAPAAEIKVPENLEEALRKVREIDSKPAIDPVANKESGSETNEDNVGLGTAEAVISEGSNDTAGRPVANAEPVNPNAGSGTQQQEQAVDYQEQVEQIKKSTAQQAANNVMKKFEEQNIKPFALSDITVRDEKNGRITFKNPDDPSKPFTSRTEATAWINSMNQEINSVFKREAQEEHKRLMQQAEPTLRLIAYAPKFEKLSEPEQDMLLEIITPYAVTDKQGNILGYNCNLSVAEATVKNQIKALLKRQESLSGSNGNSLTVEKQQATIPALDAKTSGSASGKIEDGVPKTLEDALKKIKGIK